MPRSPLALPLVAAAGVCLLRFCAPQEAFVSAAASRREVLAAATVGAVTLSGAVPALADAQGEPARALKKYGEVILALEPAVQKGDIDAVSKKLRKVELFLTAFRNSPDKKAATEKLIDAVFAAVEKKDAGALKTAYNDLVEKSQIKKLINPGYPVPKGSRIVDTSSSIAGAGYLVKQGKFEASRE